MNVAALKTSNEEASVSPEAKTQHLHRSVLLDEALDWWCPAVGADGTVPVVVDCTFGRGGHSRSLIARHNSLELVVFDKDPAAIAVAEELKSEQNSENGVTMHIAHHSFADIQQVVSKLGYHEKVQGILMDLGVSSPQLDEAERGFSFMRNGPLAVSYTHLTLPTIYSV